MNMKDFIDHVSANAGIEISKNDAEAVIHAAIGESIKAESRFAYPGFGTFTIRERPARDGRNPQTGAKMKIKASRTVAFKPPRHCATACKGKSGRPNWPPVCSLPSSTPRATMPPPALQAPTRTEAPTPWHRPCSFPMSWESPPRGRSHGT